MRPSSRCRSDSDGGAALPVSRTLTAMLSTRDLSCGLQLWTIWTWLRNRDAWCPWWARALKRSVATLRSSHKAIRRIGFGQALGWLYLVELKAHDVPRAWMSPRSVRRSSQADGVRVPEAVERVGGPGFQGVGEEAQRVDLGGADFIVHADGGRCARQRYAVPVVDLVGELHPQVKQIDDLGLAGEGFHVHAEPQAGLWRAAGPSSWSSSYWRPSGRSRDVA